MQRTVTDHVCAFLQTLVREHFTAAPKREKVKGRDPPITVSGVQIHIYCRTFIILSVRSFTAHFVANAKSKAWNKRLWLEAVTGKPSKSSINYKRGSLLYKYLRHFRKHSYSLFRRKTNPKNVLSGVCTINMKLQAVMLRYAQHAERLKRAGTGYLPTSR